MVEDLLKAWYNGITIPTPSGSTVTVRLALTCVSCDLPASRKVCGFLGHTAALGCNKCFKKFNVRSVGDVDYSGFDRENWQLRTMTDHHRRCEELQNETTKSGMRKAESWLGVRYSVLLRLPYVDAIRYTVVDVMHNLFLGTGKNTFKLWLSKDYICKEQLEEIERRIRAFNVPSSIGRLPINISSNHGGFTASQWQSWIILYSPVVLKGILPINHYQCWLLFVRACYLLSKRIVQKTDIETADLLLLNFVRSLKSFMAKTVATQIITFICILKTVC